MISALNWLSGDFYRIWYIIEGGLKLSVPKEQRWMRKAKTFLLVSKVEDPCGKKQHEKVGAFDQLAWVTKVHAVIAWDQKRLRANIDVGQDHWASPDFHPAIGAPEGARVGRNKLSSRRNERPAEAVRSTQAENTDSDRRKASIPNDIRAHIEIAGSETTTLYAINVEDNIAVV